MREKRQPAGRSEHNNGTIRCKICSNRGHTEAECRRRYRRTENTTPRPSTSSEEQNRPPNSSNLVCYGCGKPGYLRSNCPECRNRGRPQTETSAIQMDLDFYCFSAKPKLHAAPRPHFLIEVDGLKGSACLDTSARQSVAGYALYKKLCERGVHF